MLIGLCGNEGAGKTTIANVLTTGTPDPLLMLKTIPLADPKDYVVRTLFGNTFPTEQYNLSYDQAVMHVEFYMKKYIHSTWDWSYCANTVYEYDRPVQSSWIELSMADPLKYACAVLFNYDYEILSGRTPQSRTLREQTKTMEYNICGALTGRKILEYFGTDIMRDKFHPDIWVNALHHICVKHRSAGTNVVIADIRFNNEMHMLNDNGGICIEIYRDREDLVLKEFDHMLHPAKWTYKTFIGKFPVLGYHNTTKTQLLHDFNPENISALIPTLEKLY